MAFLKRLSYYLIGLSIGIIILSFIFNGKKTSCNYGPQARVKSQLLRKEINIPDSILENKINITDKTIEDFIKNSSIDFSESNTKKDSCKTYVLKGYLISKHTSIEIENCLKVITVLKINF